MPHQSLSLARAAGSAGSRSSKCRFEAEWAGAGSVVVAQAGVALSRVEGGFGWAREGCAMLTMRTPFGDPRGRAGSAPGSVQSENPDSHWVSGLRRELNRTVATLADTNRAR